MGIPSEEDFVSKDEERATGSTEITSNSMVETMATSSMEMAETGTAGLSQDSAVLQLHPLKLQAIAIKDVAIEYLKVSRNEMMGILIVEMDEMSCELLKAASFEMEIVLAFEPLYEVMESKLQENNEMIKTR